MKGRKKMFLIEKRNVARFFHHYDFKHHFLKCRTPFSVALPFYATASGQILLGSPAQTRQVATFGCQKGQFLGNGHNFKPQPLYGMRWDNRSQEGHHKSTQGNHSY